MPAQILINCSVVCSQGAAGSELVSRLTHHMTTEKLHTKEGRNSLVNAVAATAIWNACVQTLEGVHAQGIRCCPELSNVAMLYNLLDNTGPPVSGISAACSMQEVPQQSASPAQPQVDGTQI